MTVCVIEGCQAAEANSRGWCWKHYTRWRRHGDPTFTPRESREVAISRFWDKVDLVHPAGCWTWTGYISDEGYGVVGILGVRHRAHRFAFEILRGPIREGLVLDHLCRNRPCVNPDHLEPTTIRDNLERGRTYSSRDRCKRGHPFDEANTYLWRGGRLCRTCRAMHTATRKR